MKKLKFLFVLLLCSITLFPDARTFALDSSKTDDRIEERLLLHLTDQLIEGIWFQADDEYTNLLFTVDGLATKLAHSDRNIRIYENYNWHLEIFGEDVLLVFADLDYQSAKTYRVIQTSGAMRLTNTEDGSMEIWHAKARRDHVALTSAERSLVGSWQCSVFPSDDDAQTYGAFTYQLETNGTFVRSFYQNEDLVAEQHGAWQLAPEGNYLILYLKHDANQWHDAQLIRIDHLAYDELVLGAETAFCAKGKSFCQNQWSFYFNKI